MLEVREGLVLHPLALTRTLRPRFAPPHAQVVPAMAAAGRGGSSDVGQKIRDEILAVQSRNHCKGGMMEEW